MLAKMIESECTIVQVEDVAGADEIAERNQRAQDLGTEYEWSRLSFFEMGMATALMCCWPTGGHEDDRS